LLAGGMKGAVEAGHLGAARGPFNKSYFSEIEEHKKGKVRHYLHDFDFDRVLTACF
jgi:hypothetical protein